MIDGKKVLAIIPARGGSKRLPRKNILPLAGKPLIAWTIEAAKDSEYIDEVLVSTDDEEIASVANAYGGYVPELRPQELSNDSATTENVVLHVLNKYGLDYDILIILQPTSPLRNKVHIDEALKKMSSMKATSIISITPCEHSPLWANKLPPDGVMEHFLSSQHDRCSQELEIYYRLNGAIYIYDVGFVLAEKSLRYTNKTYSYEMSNHYSIDIDNKLDFEIANFLIEKHSEE